MCVSDFKLSYHDIDFIGANAVFLADLYQVGRGNHAKDGPDVLPATDARDSMQHAGYINACGFVHVLLPTIAALVECA